MPHDLAHRHRFHLGIVEELVGRADRGAGDSDRHEVGLQLARRPGRDDRVDLRAEFRGLRDALGVRRVGGVGGQIVAADRLAEELPELVRAGGDEDRPVGRREHAVREDARRPRDLGVERQQVGLCLGAHDRLEQGGFDALALAGALAVEQRRVDRADEQHRRHVVRHRHRADGGDAVHLLLQVRGAGHRLEHRVVPRTLGVRAAAAEGAGGGVDEARIVPAERFVVDAQPRGDAGAEVLHRHVGVAGQVMDDLLALGRLQIDRDAALVPVPCLEHAALAFDEGPPVASVVAAGRFDLEDVGAHVAEQHGAVGTGDEAREVEDPDAVQRAVGALVRRWPVRHPAILAAAARVVC